MSIRELLHMLLNILGHVHELLRIGHIRELLDMFEEHMLLRTFGAQITTRYRIGAAKQIHTEGVEANLQFRAGHSSHAKGVQVTCLLSTRRLERHWDRHPASSLQRRYSAYPSGWLLSAGLAFDLHRAPPHLLVGRSRSRCLNWRHGSCGVSRRPSATKRRGEESRGWQWVTDRARSAG